MWTNRLDKGRWILDHHDQGGAQDGLRLLRNVLEKRFTSGSKLIT